MIHHFMVNINVLQIMNIPHLQSMHSKSTFKTLFNLVSTNHQYYASSAPW
uniref:Uncharacterized protein n=1 Tax=Setaria italica TaxID=4555 RepID=K4AI13_SETIT